MTICNIERIQCCLLHSQSGLFCAVSRFPTILTNRLLGVNYTTLYFHQPLPVPIKETRGKIWFQFGSF